MHEGSELRMHQREESVSLQIIEGVLKVTDRDGFIAMDETIFLLNLQSKY
jgi:hypothetical protein